jgi:alkylated DNA repair dioxygenase AlkB
MTTMNLAPNIHIVKSFIAHPEILFTLLQDKVEWDERLRSRKTASFGVAYEYSGMTYPQVEMLAELLSICDRIYEEVSFYPNNCLINYYPDGSASMGFHSDSSEELSEGTGVAIVSLGAERTIVFRSKVDRSIEFSFNLRDGDLLFMPQQIQSEWLHGIPKSPGVGERISLTFRSIVKS